MGTQTRAAGQQRPAMGTGGLLELEVGEAAHGGWCVAREPAGRVIFVRHALPGELVRARITGATARFARADAVEILRASPDRVRPPCPQARPDGCGGCDWQHASLAAQRRLKAGVISQQLRRIAGVDREVTVEELPGDSAGLGWRTQVRFSAGPDGIAGLRKHRSHEVVAIGTCPIAHPLVQQLNLTGQRWDGVSTLAVAASPGSGETAVIVSGEPGSGQSMAAGKLAGSASTVLVAGRHGRLTPLRGHGYLHHTAAGRTWRTGAGTFWQVHPGAAGTLADAVLAALAPAAGQVALDLFCGAGLFAGVLAAAVGPDGTVIGLEGDRAAVRDARHNLRDMPWARIHHGDVAALLARGGWPEPDLAVLDPPRSGAGRAVLLALLAPAGRLRRVAYVSCDPATMARDIAVCRGLGWQLTGLRAFDAFPMTHHVECLATLAPA